jgi:hypothetical protein
MIADCAVGTRGTRGGRSAPPRRSWRPSGGGASSGRRNGSRSPIGALFLTTSYYLWQCVERMRGAEKYLRYVKYLVFVMIVSFLIFITPHTMVMTPAELKAMGGQQHPVLGNYGVMSAKNGGINVMIVTTILSFIWYQRGNKIPTVSWAKFGNIVMGTFFALAYVNIIWLAVYG